MNGLTDSTNEAIVEVIRTKFLYESYTNPHLYHPIDIERVRSEHWQIERFVLATVSEYEAFEALVKAMQWKKSFGLQDRIDSYFPKELSKISGNEELSRDIRGRLAAWGVLCNYKKIEDFNLILKQYLGHQIEKLDRIAGNKGSVLVSDLKDIDMSNVDMKLIKFSIELLNYYPNGMRLGLNVDMPSIMGSIWKVVKKFYNKKLRDILPLIKRYQLTEYFDVNEIPVSFGGQRQPVIGGSDKQLPLNELNHLGFTSKQIENFYKVYNFQMNGRILI